MRIISFVFLLKNLSILVSLWMPINSSIGSSQKSGWFKNAPLKSRLKKDTYALVIPHVGHGIPVNHLNGQPIFKVSITKIYAVQINIITKCFNIILLLLFFVLKDFISYISLCSLISSTSKIFIIRTYQCIAY